jgi:DNA-binding transcriptional regulator LsrR (DeoR family)
MSIWHQTRIQKRKMAAIELFIEIEYGYYKDKQSKEKIARRHDISLRTLERGMLELSRFMGKSII